MESTNKANIKVFVKAVKSKFKTTLCDALEKLSRDYDEDDFSCDVVANVISVTINCLFNFDEFADQLVDIKMFDVEPFRYVMNDHKFYVNGDDIFDILYRRKEFSKYKYLLN